MLAALAMIAGCAAAGRAESAREERPGIYLTKLAQTRLPKEVEQFGRVGGLSGAALLGVDADGTMDVLFASDAADAPRAIHAKVRLEQDAASRRWSLSIALREEFETWWRAEDLEALAHDPENAMLYLAFEKPPIVMEHDLAVAQGARMYRGPEELGAGFRVNRAFESLAYRPIENGSDELWAAMEAAIESDGDEASVERGTLCRTLVLDAGSMDLDRQYFYETDPRPEGLPGAFAINSLAEMAALPDGRILFLERSFAIPRGYDARIYVVDPDRTTEHEGRAFPTLGKVLVADVKKLGFVSLGNLEAMVVGPPIAELVDDPVQEGRLLLLIADDNFGSDGQDGTQVIALRMMLDSEKPGE